MMLALFWVSALGVADLNRKPAKGAEIGYSEGVLQPV